MQHVHYRETRKRREKKKGTENLFEEIIAENFTNLVNKTDIQTQKAEKSL